MTGSLCAGEVLDGVDDGGHSNIQVLAYVQGNLVATTLTDATGQFAAHGGLSRRPHADIFARGHETQTEIAVRWDEHEQRFEIDDTPLAEYEATRLVRLTGQIRVSVEMAPNWIPVEQRDVTVEVVGDDVELSAQAVGNGAAVEFTDLPAGSYFVSVERNGFTARFKRILVDDGAATHPSRSQYPAHKFGSGRTRPVRSRTGTS